MGFTIDTKMAEAIVAHEIAVPQRANSPNKQLPAGEGTHHCHVSCIIGIEFYIIKWWNIAGGRHTDISSIWKQTIWSWKLSKAWRSLKMLDCVHCQSVSKLQRLEVASRKSIRTGRFVNGVVWSIMPTHNRAFSLWLLLIHWAIKHSLAVCSAHSAEFTRRICLTGWIQWCV